MKNKRKSNAERQQKFREKLRSDPERFEAHKAKERARWHERRAKGKVKVIGDMTKREKRAQRKKWRKAKREEAERRKQNQQALESMLSPPASPADHRDAEPVAGPSGAAQRGRKRVKKSRAKAYRELFKLKIALKKEKLKSDMYRKRYERFQQSSPGTPRKQTKQALSGSKVNSEVKKTLVFHHVLIQSLREKYKKTRSVKGKQLICKVVACTRLLEKYRFLSRMKNDIGISMRTVKNIRDKSDNENLVKYHRKHSTSMLNAKAAVKVFLERDDNSRITTSKQDTITREKVKQQRLRDTLKNMFLKFKAENTDIKLSYSLFCRFKPFYIQYPNAKDRETCLCKIHDNGQLMCNKLKYLNILPPLCTRVEKCAEDICCLDSPSQLCFYRQCNTCKEKTISTVPDDKKDETVSWFQWVSVTEKYQERKNLRAKSSSRREMVQ